MAFIAASTKGSSERVQFENRLEKCKLKPNRLPNYSVWFLTSYLVIRTHDTHYTIHTNGDIDHYEVLSRKYQSISYECSDYKFLLTLLLESTKETAKLLLK